MNASSSVTGASTDGTGSLDSSANSAGDAADAPPPPPSMDDGPSSRFDTQTLSALISSQSGTTSSTGGSNLADNLISAFDTNGDGELSLSELDSALGVTGSSTTSSTSTDGTSSTDGSNNTGSTLTSSEVATAFAKLDTNGDGEIDGSELTAGLKQMHGGGHAHHHHAAGSAQDMASSLMNSLDTNGDGSLSLSELTSALSGTGSSSSTSGSTTDSSDSSTATSTTGSQLSSLFNKLDTDGSGSISLGELTTAFQQMLDAQQSYRNSMGGELASSGLTASMSA